MKDLDYRNIKGIDNVEDPAKIGSGFLTRGLNVDTDDSGMLHRRAGYRLQTAGSFHSLWGNGTIGLCVHAGYLKSIGTDYSLTTLLAVSSDARMQYVDVAGTVYLTNDIMIWSLRNGMITSFSTPTVQFKNTMVAGHLIEYFNSRLYVARDTVLCFSDPANLQQLDTRRYRIPFDGHITMVKAVMDGLYVSTGDKTYFLAGPSPSEMKAVLVAGSGAFEGSAITLDGETITGGGLGRVVIWTSGEGVFVGGPQGSVRNKTWNHYEFDDAISYATAVCRYDNGYGQYVLAYPLEQRLLGTMTLPRIEIEGILVEEE